MTTITQTLETITFTAKAPAKQLPKPETVYCPPGCKCRDLQPVCPPGCSCKTRSSKTSKMFFNAVGIIIAILATYLMISTDSKLYLVFWVAYSVLRRMIVKSTLRSLKSKTD